jgi:NADH dehydrogenase (ubiquinone) 1 alpha subcomplex subunit 2
MKHHNPHTPIMVREALNTQPRVFARYEFGREKVEELGGEFSILCVWLPEAWSGQ